MSKNKNVVEMHGCIVCAKQINILVMYSPEDKLLDCTVTSRSGHIVKDENRPLVACDSHTAGEIKAYKRWKSQNNES